MQGYPDWNIGANITRQDLAFLIQRWFHGTAQRGYGTALVAKYSERIIAEVTGRGIAQWFLFAVAAKTESHNTSFDIFMDNLTTYPLWDLWMLVDIGYTATTPFVQVLKYAIDGEIYVQVLPQIGWTFESSLKIRANNPTAYDQNMFVWFNFTLV